MNYENWVEFVLQMVNLDLLQFFYCAGDIAEE